MLFSDEVFFFRGWNVVDEEYFLQQNTQKYSVFVCRSWLCFRKNGKGGACGLS